MTRLADNAGRDSLRDAAKVIADASKKISGRFSRRIPASTKVVMQGNDVARVSAGGPGGKDAPNAYMFETKGARHPLFEQHGHAHHWYLQPYRPFLEEGAEDALDEAADKYADGVIKVWSRQLK